MSEPYTQNGPSRFPDDVVARIDREEEVEIETWSMAGEPRRTIIWVVVDDGRVYVRSVRGERGRWYREIRTEPHAALLVAGERVEVQAVPVDEESIAACSAALERKYAADPALRSMLRPDVLSTTLRLDPA